MIMHRHKFSVEDYERMVSTGILGESDRVELLRGEIVQKTTIGDTHAACVMRLVSLLPFLLAHRAFISPQNPIKLIDSVPEPDIAILQPREDFYQGGKPTPQEVFLLIEVADSSLDYDRTEKLSIYAESGIQEYWIVNLVDNVIEIHRGPQSDGTFAHTQNASKSESIALLAFPEIYIPVARILGQ